MSLLKLYLIALVCSFMCIQCSNVGMSPNADYAGGSPHHPIVPYTESPLPLAEGNQWSYRYNSYDSLGAPLITQDTLEIILPRVFGLTDTGLTRLYYSWGNTENLFKEYVFAYEKEKRGAGDLVAYLQKDVTLRGLYILGYYKYQKMELHAEPRLWLPYPSSVGFKWRSAVGDSASTDSIYGEVISKTARYYSASGNESNSSPLSFYTCYLYKETAKDFVDYTYYNEKVGMLGLMSYSKSGKLITTCQLTHFSNGDPTSQFLGD